jgi:hypothetical protein
LAIDWSESLRPCVCSFGQPRDEARQVPRRDVRQPQLLGVIAVRELIEQALVLGARSLAEAAPTGSVVGADPLGQVGAQLDRPALRKPAAVVVYLGLALDPARFVGCPS